MQNQRITQVNRYTIPTIFLALTLFALVDMLEVIPYFAPVVDSPLFPFLHESHDLFSLILTLFSAYKLSPTIGWWAISWFIVIHIPYVYIVFPKELPELLRLVVLSAVAGFGIHNIAIRNRLVTQLNKLA
ncbi:MAG: hypothetical protein HZB50_08785, partial [Chloroflexi bacterium]|nr:hypothetical protein [Chloroflexota bacterium]